MKRLIATIILIIISIVIAGCDITYSHVGYHHGYGPRAVIVTRAPYYGPGPDGCHRPYGPYPHRHWRGR